MGKERELWDDSALIKAFDSAVSKYKIMHGKTGEIALTPTEEILGDSEAVNGRTELTPSLNIEIEETAEVSESKGDSPFDSGSSAIGIPNIEESKVPPTSIISATTSVSPGEDTVSTNLQCQKGATYNLDGSEEYNNLLNKYYEVENQRQQILQQLNRYSNWDSQYPFSSTSTTEECQAFAHQPYQTVACNCQYGCQNWVVPCNSSTAACSGGNYNGTTCDANGSPNGKSGPKEVPDFLKTVMAAAEKALSLAKEPNLGIYKQLGVETGQSPVSKSATNLDVVLGAWYTAGFYTGKYVSEQSSEGSKQGRNV